MLNRDIFQNDPIDSFLANNGVAKVTDEKTIEALNTLEYELKTFVCDGKYQQGIDLILRNFLDSLLTGNEQKGVWISGFFGSGKSHLAKMLSSLWINQTLANGQSGRSLADLPESTQNLLEQLSQQAITRGGLHSAAGTLGASAGKKVRLSLLSVIFKSVGLPEQYHLAKFCLWLSEQGVLEKVKQAVFDKMHGANIEETWAKEVRNLHVSPVLHQAILQAIPALGSDTKEVREMLRSQYAIVDDISNDEMVDAAVDALSLLTTTDGKIPLTLVVLDEVQQYIGNDLDRAMEIQEAVETCCKASKLKSKMLFIGTGQSALAGMTNLQRLMGRFQTPVQLEDTDVDAVIRKVILQKKESARSQIQSVIDSNLGEISRHLHGSTIEHHKDDEQFVVADYPLLPVRRRFWEKVLHALDVTGTGSQLRNQLRIVHEACKVSAEKTLGNVLPADFIYDQIATNLLQTNVISKDIYETIARKKAGDADSQQQARVLALILLIGKLPTDVDHGIAPTEGYLADLLIEDLQNDKHRVRSELPGWLAALQTDGLLMSMLTHRGLEYRLQTAESSQWYDEFNKQKNDYRGNPQRIEGYKQQLIQQHVRKAVSDARLLQGISNVSRSINCCFEGELAIDNAEKLYAWVHNASEKAFLDSARAARSDQATIFIYVPNSHQSDVADAIIELKAAEITLELRGNASTEAGSDAKKAMDNSRQTAERKLNALLKEIYANIQVKLAGGADVDGDALIDQIRNAGNIAVERLYKDFMLADDANWAAVYTKAKREGGENALEALGFKEETAKHPVCQTLLRYIGVGKLGKEVSEQFSAAPYGWSDDAIAGALFAMLAAGVLTGIDSTGQPVSAKTLDRTALGKVNLRPEKIQLTKIELIQVRSLINALGIPCNAGEEQSSILSALKLARDLAFKTGGNAPLPASPKTDLLDQLMSSSGNELLRAALDVRRQIISDVENWRATIELMRTRELLWNDLRNVLHHCKGLNFTQAIEVERKAIIDNRSLLGIPNPIEPLIKQAFGGIRDAIVFHHGEFEVEYNRCLEQLENDEQWKKLDTSEQQLLLVTHNIDQLPVLLLADNDAVLLSLETCSLSQWNDKRASLMSRFDAARNSAIALLKPKVLHVQSPRRLIETEADLHGWLKEVEASIRMQLVNGPVSIS
ncbi:BREX system P-loop protein BrxC [Herbaspirillum sp. RTI4]|uniref:BREX system P-loop protein BrxC n=1 Tax=Herbaspirillum sp. RTI4 TaxID=3048640 RepID=UPI002AB45F01|nr:BREX system P-loop protein BrxC [Herbaspirillum sp. RTI4]MDY7579305.1 BREX system P-loop protein BrxC [Herbaspirillum sp. RTI4]MEA9980218.1 BREX system P-loop protein BrxC [Herbaspirillum sp. RTI4]